MRMRIWVVWLLLAALCLSGCGTMFPHTEYTPARSRAVDSEDTSTGGVKHETKTRIELRQLPPMPLAPVEELPPRQLPPGEENPLPVTSAVFGCTPDPETAPPPPTEDKGSWVRLPDGTWVHVAPGAEFLYETTDNGTSRPDTSHATRDLSGVGTGYSGNQAPPKSFAGGGVTDLDLSTGSLSARGGKIVSGIGATGGPWAIVIGALLMVVGPFIAIKFGQRVIGWSAVAVGAFLVLCALAAPAVVGWVLVGVLVIGAGIVAWKMGLLTKLGQVLDVKSRANAAMAKAIEDDSKANGDNKAVKDRVSRIADADAQADIRATVEAQKTQPGPASPAWRPPPWPLGPQG